MKVQPNMSELFNQAIETFDSALKTGVRIQEEATRWWTDMLRETDSLQELQHRAQSMTMEALPSTQKNADQYMQLLDKSYHASLELMNRAFQATQSGSLTDTQHRLQEFWESTFAAMRTNAQAMVQLNSRTMETWSEMARRETSETWSATKETAKETAREAEREMGQMRQAAAHAQEQTSSRQPHPRPRTRTRTRTAR